MVASFAGRRASGFLKVWWNEPANWFVRFITVCAMRRTSGHLLGRLTGVSFARGARDRFDHAVGDVVANGQQT
jgi:hypothetical protein